MADYLQRDPYSKRALLEEGMINIACVFKVLQSCGAGMACQKVVTRLFIKHTVFLSRSFRCGSHAFKATKQQQVSDAQMGLHNCNTFRNITLTNSNKFIHIVTLRHNSSYRPPYDVDFSAKERVTLLSGHPNGDTQLLNLGTVSFAHIKAARNKCLNLKIKITF